MTKEICMLARPWDESIDPTGWWMSEKFHGERMIRPRGNVDVFSREGNVFRPPSWWLDQLPHGPFLDGEAFIGYGKFELTQSILAKRPATDEEWEQVTFRCIEPVQEPGCIIKGNKVFRPIHQTVCAGRNHLQVFYDSIVKSGGEGVVLRHPKQPYHLGRSPYLLKVKPEIKAIAQVFGYNYDESGRLTSLKCRWFTGISLEEQKLAAKEHRSPVMPPPTEFNLSNGLTEEMRANPPPVGSNVKLVYQCMTANKKPHMPRLDK